VITATADTPVRVESEGVEYRALGPLTVVVDGEERKLGGPRQRMVLAVLLAHWNHTVSQDALIEEVWAGEPPEAAKATMQNYVHLLRRELGADAIARHGGGYRVEVDEGSFDVLRFETMVSQARHRLAEDPTGAAKLLKAALALWFGTPYGGLDTNPILAGEVARLEELRLVAVETRIEGDLAAGNHAEVIGELDALVREHPLRERFRAQQMLALYRAGRQADALRAYEKTRVYLVEELGIDPSAELRDLEQRILEQDPSLDLEVAVSRQCLAFLLTDADASTLPWDSGAAATREAMDIQGRIISDAVESHQGSVFRRTGDGVHAFFADVAQAVAAASVAQAQLVVHEWGDAGEVRVRMAVDVGVVEVRGGDFNGRVLSLRRDDMRAISALMDTTIAGAMDRLRSWDVLVEA
jgi:DNA-binding SARP family transcriptional activator